MRPLNIRGKTDRIYSFYYELNTNSALIHSALNDEKDDYRDNNHQR